MIPKTTNSERLKENIGALEVTLAQEDIEKINGLDCGKRYFNPAVWANKYGCNLEPIFE